MRDGAQRFSRLDAKRREQTPQALARLVVVTLFVALWFVLWVVRMPAPLPFLIVLLIEILFFLVYWRVVSFLPTVRAVSAAQYVMLAAEILFHTTMVYFLGSLSWLGAFAYVFGLIFANAFLDLRRGMIYTAGACAAFSTLILLEATGTVPHYVYLDQSALRYTDPQFVVTTLLGAAGVFTSIYLWSSWVGHQLRRERDTALRAQDDLLQARVQLLRVNEELDERVRARTAELETANAALSESQQQLRLVLETCPDLISIQEPDGRYRFANAAHAAVLGYAPEELVGRSPNDLIHADDLETVREQFRRSFTSGDPAEVVARMRHADGRWVTLEANGRIMVDASGEISGIVIVSRDVTERKRAEEALRESEERFRLFAEYAADGIVMVDGAGRIAMVNYEAERMFGYGRDDLLGQPVEHLIPESLQGAHRRHSAGYYAEPRPRPMAVGLDLRARRKDGTEFPADISLTSMKMGSDLLVAATIRDITERKRAERALRQSEETLKATIESTADGILVIHPERHVAYANRRFAEMWGVPHELLAPGSDSNHIVTYVLDQLEDPDEFLAMVEKIRQTAGEWRDLLKCTDGRVIELYARALLKDGQIVGRVVSCRDVTERKRAETLLEQQRAVLETIAVGAPLEDVLEQLVLMIEGQAKGALCGVCLVDAAGLVLLPAAGPSLPPPFVEALASGVPISASAGSCGTAAFRGETVIASDIASDPLWDGYRDLALAHGLRACWSTPIFSSSGSVLGTFAMYHREEHRPSPVERRLVDMATHVASMAIVRKRAEEALRESARRDALTNLLNHVAITDELRGLIAESGEGVSHAVAMVDIDGLKSVNDTYGHPVGDVVLLAVANALARNNAVVGRYGGDEFVAILRDTERAAAERYRDAVLEALTDANVTDPETGAHVPVVASIGLAIYPEEAATIDDLISLSDNAMYASRRQRPLGHTSVDVLGELAPLLTAPGDLNDKLRLVAHRLSAGTGFDAVDFALFAPKPGAPLAQNTFAQGTDELMEAWHREQLDDSPVPHPIRLLFERAPRPVILDDPWNDELLLEGQRAILKAAGLRSVLVAPMIWQDQVIGSLGVASRREHAFGPRDAHFLAAAATHVTTIVRIATLVEELRSTSDRLADARDETVLLLAAAAEARDHVTGLHLQNVRALTEALARELGYGEAKARELGLAAVLHDIGKIRVPDAVLTHSSRLSSDAWELMKQHTVWGADFLAGQPGFELAAAIARAHHEHWDGTGYPLGLAGEAIPEPAAIVSLADAFDAMTSDRPYKKRRSVSLAIGQIAVCSGKQFSPRVVEALLRLYQRKALPLPSRASPRAA